MLFLIILLLLYMRSIIAALCILSCLWFEYCKCSQVYKSGSFGRSLDITKFSSYHELRGELARMFCLEGELEDPLRSGWQLVFVDRENDVLLLGDDPWP